MHGKTDQIQATGIMTLCGQQPMTDAVATRAPVFGPIPLHNVFLQRCHDNASGKCLSCPNAPEGLWIRYRLFILLRIIPVSQVCQFGQDCQCLCVSDLHKACPMTGCARRLLPAVASAAS